MPPVVNGRDQCLAAFEAGGIEAKLLGQMIQFLTRRLSMEDRPLALRKLLSHTKSSRALVAMFLALLELVRLQASSFVSAMAGSSQVGTFVLRSSRQARGM